MVTPDTTPFGGVAGRVARESLSIQTFLSGLVLATVAGISVLILGRFGAHALAAIGLQILPLMFLARFALNGYSGEWCGTIFSGRGGSPWDVLVVAGRQLLLMILWCLPVLLLLRARWGSAGDLGASVPLLLMSGDRAILLIAFLYMIALALTPPVFLITSVGAQSTTQLFSPGLWRGLFQGRIGDLFLIYAVYLGSLLFVVLLFIPVAALVYLSNPSTGVLFIGAMLAFAVGFALNLLGRLCGFFAALASTEEMQPQAAPSPREAASPASTPRPQPGLRGGAAVVVGSPSGLHPGDDAGGAEPVGAGAVGAEPLGPAPLGRIATPSGKGPLLDARERVDRIAARAESDPSGALRELKDLDREFAPNPLVLDALARLQLKLGPEEEAHQGAERALQTLLGRGHIRLAAQLFAEVSRRAPGAPMLQLRRDQRLAIAEELSGMGEAASAIPIWRAALQEDPGDRRTLKVLIRVGEAMTRDADQVPSAVEIFRMLLDLCSDSPLLPLIEQRLAEAERRVERSEQRTA